MFQMEYYHLLVVASKLFKHKDIYDNIVKQPVRVSTGGNGMSGNGVSIDAFDRRGVSLASVSGDTSTALEHLITHLVSGFHVASITDETIWIDAPSGYDVGAIAQVTYCGDADSMSNLRRFVAISILVGALPFEPLGLWHHIEGAIIQMSEINSSVMQSLAGLEVGSRSAKERYAIAGLLHLRETNITRILRMLNDHKHHEDELLAVLRRLRNRK